MRASVYENLVRLRISMHACAHKRGGEVTSGVMCSLLPTRVEPLLLPCNLRTCTRKEIQEYFLNTYHMDEVLFSAVRNEKYMYKCPDRLRLPLIFYLAHPATLYVNKLLLAGLISKRVNPPYETMFETGVDEMSWDDTENFRMGGAFHWPGVKEVMEYRKIVKQLISDLIISAPLILPITMEHPWWSLFMGMEHERMHLETSSVLIRQLPVEFVKRPDNWNYAPISMNEPAGENIFVKVPPRKVAIGKPLDFPSYGWDNEYGQLDTYVPEFEATQYLVSNREFLDFVVSGSYQKRELWTEEGWQWVQYRQARHPTFWVCSEGCKSGCGADLATYTHCNLPKEEEENGSEATSSSSKYQYRAMFDVLSMPWDWPVDVNYHEAKAFCSWKGPSYRLPTEAEHHRLRGDLPPSSDPNCDPIFSTNFQANINLKYGSSSPVNMFPPNALGFYDTYGNVWEWAEDHFNGLPGFKTHYLYDDYSTPSFDGRHTMMMGGSWATCGNAASRFVRFCFRRHFFQHMGFRMVRSISSLPLPVCLCRAEVFLLGSGVTENPIPFPMMDEAQAYVSTANQQFLHESVQKLDEMLAKQYSQSSMYGLPLVKLVEDAVGKYSVSTNSVINFGCGAGLTAFLLSNTFKKVVGVDFCGRFIDAAMKIQSGKVLQYGPQQVAKLPSEASSSRVCFKQLTWIPNELVGFDVVVFEFIERLNEPKGWLYKLWEVLNPKGLAVFVSSSDWDSKKIDSYIGKWFILVEETAIDGRNVYTWQLK